MAPNNRDFHGISSPRKRNISSIFVCSKLNEPPKQGEIFCDIRKKKWKLGRCIGVGAFGDIFVATNDVNNPVGLDAPYVVKMEPQSNGPLFVEMNFYLRTGQEKLIEEWKKERGLKVLGMPTMLGFGFHTIKSVKYRFIVLPRYGENVQSLFVKQGKHFHVKTAFTIASHTLDVLEYIHSHGYLHLDIKGQNMLLGDGNGSAPLYLVDFGLATRYRIHGRHKCRDEAEDQRIAEAGTLDYSSRRSHIGVMSRRDDLESLGFNLVHWLSGWLPWLDELDRPEVVFDLKQKAMANPSGFLTSAFHPSRPPPALQDYLLYVDQLGFKTKPDYDYCRQLFSQAISSEGFAPDKIISFDGHAKLRKAKKRKIEIENQLSNKKRLKPTFDFQRKPCCTQNYDPISTRVTRTQADGPPDFDWATVLAGDPEKLVKKKKESKVQHSVKSEDDDDVVKEDFVDDVFNNPTPEMCAVICRMMKKRNPSRTSGRKQKVTESNGPPSYLTPAMKTVIARQRKAAANSQQIYSPKALRSSKRKSTQLSTDAIIACGRF